MNTSPDELTVINQKIFPMLLGAPRFRPVQGKATHLGYAESAVFQSLLSHLKPRCSIEVGTEEGITLAVIARHSKKVFSIDIDPGVRALAKEIPNVEYLTGSSHDVLPVLLAGMADAKLNPDFIFVDGDHSEQGVRKDIDFILNVKPLQQMVVMMHDTFNPGCRAGIRSADWARNPYCHYVDLDFCPGVLHPDQSVLRQMWGGLGFALFLPTPRNHTLDVKTTHELMFQAALQQSVHAPTPSITRAS